MYEDENGDGTYNEGENLCFTGTTNNDGRLEITSSTNNGEQVLAKGEYVLVETVPGGYVDEQTSVRVIVDDDGNHRVIITLDGKLLPYAKKGQYPW